MDSASARFFDVPELVNHLVQHLNHAGISRLMRTSRRMEAICTPALYFHVTASFGSHKANFFGSAKSIKALSKNACYVRQLDVGRHDIVYYTNCVHAFLDQQQATPIPTIVARPAWLAPPDPHIHTVLPIPPMTMLTRLDLDLRTNEQERDEYKSCPYYLPSYRDPKATLTQVCWIIDSNPRLVDITMTAVLIKDRRDALLLTKTLYRLQRLRTLYLAFTLWDFTTRSLMPKIVLDLFFACPRNLCRLTLASHLRNEYRQLIAFPGEYNVFEPETQLSWERPDEECGLTTSTMPQRQELLQGLRELQLGRLDQYLTGNDIISILRHCPNLTTLQLPRLRKIDDIQRLGREIAQWCPKLSDLQQANRPFLRGDQEFKKLLIWILRALPPQQVTRFIWRGVPSATIRGLDDAGSIFRRHSTTLKEISLNSYRNIDSKSIQTILVECGALEKCEITWPMHSDQRLLCLHLEDAIEFPWACTRIQDLRLTIVIPEKLFPRLADGQLPYYDRPPPITLSADETQEFRALESFYRQLGILTELRQLKLRALISDPTGQRRVSWDYGKVAFPGMLSLGSEKTGRPGYLHLLGGLKKLTKLVGSVRLSALETRVTVGMHEVEWMDRHWPALEEAGFCTNLSMAPNPLCWFVERREQKGRKLDVCVFH
ncbi:hypothetical protein BKA57DRAFT_453048 [Linnemannia elongata]|nr:hypothetical protein BKA57DRAFT_453048 [Linnemannia elongata]